jgi:hypothetical protein
LKLEAVCSSKKSEQFQWPRWPYFKHTEDPDLSQTKINSMAMCSDTNSKFCFCKGNWRSSVSSCVNLISITSVEKPFNECCIIYSYCSPLQSQPKYPIVTFRHLFSSALQETVCDRHTSAFLVNNQLDASIPFNIFTYFQLSTCFEHYVLIIRRDQIVLTHLLVIVTPCSLQCLVMVGSRLVL